MESLNKFPSQTASSQFVPYVTAEEISGMVSSLALTISQKYEGEDLVVIGLLKGSSFFVCDLIRQIRNVNIYLDFVLLDSVGRTKEDVGTIRLAYDIKSNIRSRNVLLVQEIIHSARGMEFLKKRLELAQPRSIEVLSLFDKPFGRTGNIKPNYIGKRVDDHFIVGYGLNLDQYGRNLKNTYYLKYPN